MLLLLNKIQEPFFKSNDAIPPVGGTPAPTNKDDMIDFLNADDENDEVIPLVEPKKDKEISKGKEDEEEPDDEKEDEVEDEEDDELKDLEDELEGPTDEQLELVTPVRRKEILKKYPTLFKDFPYLEKAYYREQQFTELLPTIEDAKAAVESKQILDRFENDVMGGNTETILKSVKAENPQAFYKIVDDYLPTLARVDEKAYIHVLSNVTKHTIVTMVQEAKRSGNEVLQNAAQILNQFVFGSSNFEPPKKLSRESAPEDRQKDNELSQREREFNNRQFVTAQNDLNTRVNNALKNTIDANLDPKKSMSDYVRKNAAREAIETLEILISKDSRFKVLTDKLWERAFNDGFTKESTDRIRSAYVSKAKTLLPSVIKKARNDALRGMGKRVREEEDTTPSKGPVPAGKPRSQSNSGKISKAAEIPKGMSSLEFLNSD